MTVIGNIANFWNQSRSVNIQNSEYFTIKLGLNEKFPNNSLILFRNVTEIVYFLIYELIFKWLMACQLIYYGLIPYF